MRARSAVSLFVAAVALGCTSGPSEPVSRPQLASERDTRGRATLGGDVVATVDGHPITVAEVEEVAREAGLSPLDALRRLEEEMVLVALAERRGLADDVEAERAARRAAVRALLERDIEAPNGPATISAEDIEARGRQLAPGLSSGETRRASHALIRLAEDAPEARVEAAYRLARRILEQVRAAPEPARALDEHAGTQGGFEVEVEHMDAMARDAFLAPFAELLFAASSPGVIDEPVRTSFGVHVVVLEEIVEPWEVPREEWEPVVRRQLVAERRARALERLATVITARTPVHVDAAAARFVETVPLDARDGTTAVGGR